MRITMLVVSPLTKQHRLYLEQWADGISDGPHCHNNGHGPHYHNGLLEYPLLAADLHQPYRLEQWAAGISDGPHCHNNGLGPHCHNTDGLEGWS